mmetsp:Transcript_13336/g.41131  ORF Transcript_13336/g.41131 Transcript_13336/m.41131 type:complete len:338 (+) Transcript_13336:91-1104(+)
MIRRRSDILLLGLVLLARSGKGLVKTTLARPALRHAVAVVEAEPATAAPAASADVAELTPAERARTCASLGVPHGASLATQSAAMGGIGFASFADFVLDADGAPVLLLDATRAEHAKNLAADPRCSLLLAARGSAAATAAAPRVTVGGSASPVPADAADRVVLETQFGVAHPYADALLAGGGFDLWRVSVDSVYFVGGFGVAAQWVDAEEYREAAPDAVAPDAVDLCRALNEPKHAADLSTVAATLLGVDGDDGASIAVAGVDRLGLELRVTTRDAADEYRVAFRVPARSVEDAKSEINKLFQEAWELEQGVEYAGAYEDAPAVVKRASSASPFTSA